MCTRNQLNDISGQMVSIYRDIYGDAVTGVFLYGSYANGTNNAGSDFDVLVIAADAEKQRDTAIVAGVQLDAFIYPAAYFAADYDCSDFPQLLDSRIISDTDDIGKKLRDNVLAYLHSRPAKSAAELRVDIDWCTKMCRRTERHDAEALFRLIRETEAKMAEKQLKP